MSELAIEKDLLRAGVIPENLGDEQIRELARCCLDCCYYVDLAADELCSVLQQRWITRGIEGHDLKR